ncbi:MAG: SF1B family DNA helicase RecD2 [Myxococcota bacterium]
MRGRQNNQSSAPGRDDKTVLKGTLDRIRFESDNGEFAVCDLDVKGRRGTVTMVGNIMSARPGESVEVTGEWQNNPKFGRQFRIESMRVVPPTTREGIEKYLASGFVDGIGPVLAERIVDKFGEDTLDVLDAEPGRIREVEGIGKVRAEKIGKAWDEQRQVRSVMVFLQSHGVSPTYAAKIWKRYGDRSIQIVRENPYKLAEDIRGIGFRIADSIALEAGLERDSLARLRAGLLYVLRQAHSDGHMYLPLDELRDGAVELLEVPKDMLGAAIESLKADDKIVLEPQPRSPAPAVYREAAHRAETGVAQHLRRVIASGGLLNFTSLTGQLEEIEDEMGIELASQQREAALSIWKDNVAVVTGGPGTGKTTIIRAVCELAGHFNQKLALAAPTGRAAKRMSEATGVDARTVHRLLEFAPNDGGFTRNEETPLKADVVIVDEASMMDTYLMHALVRALDSGTRLLLVGDVDQLPSVGPGDVLADIIVSETVRVVRLTEIFRQAQESTIVQNAHRINRGLMPVVPSRGGGELVDFYTISAESPQLARERIVQLVTERVPDAFGFDPIDEVQILSPMHRGDVGCEALNETLQAEFHGGGPELVRGSKKWTVGDKVMQTRNNYERDVFNGDIGRVARIDTDDEELVVDFDGREVTYPKVDLDELMLAYAVTVHKAQGSEYPVVIMPVVTQHYVLLQRNLLYTAVTRARELVILVGSERAVEIAVQNDRARHRYTLLAKRLRGD